MNEHPEAINHISENFKQLIHDFCNMEETPLDLDFAEFNNCISAVERSCDLAYNIVRKAYKQAEADKGFKEPGISKKYFACSNGVCLDPCKFIGGTMKIGSTNCKISCKNCEDYSDSENWVKCEKYHNEIKPRVIKGTKAQVIEELKKPMADMGIDINRDITR